MIDIADKQHRINKYYEPEPLEIDIPAPCMIQIDKNGHISDYRSATIDSMAFVNMVEFIRSHGPHYLDQLRGIKAVLPYRQPDKIYRTFMIWSDFAKHVAETVGDVNEDVDQTDKEINQPDRIHERLAMFNEKPNQRAFLSAMRDEPPFLLSLQKDQYHLRIIDWVRQQEETIRKRYGDKNINAFTRAGYVLSRGLNSAKVKQWVKVGAIKQVTDENPDEAWGVVNLEITDPNEFFVNALSLTNFGVKLAIATLCIADMQREERENQILTNENV